MDAMQAYDIYLMQCILYLPDSAQTVPTPVDVWQEDRIPPITQRGVWVYNSNGIFSGKAIQVGLVGMTMDW